MKSVKSIIGIVLCAAVIASLCAIVGCSAPVSEVGGSSQERLNVALRYGEYTVRCSDDAAPLIELLGSDYSYSESVSCNYAHNGVDGADGMDKFYDYSDASITTCPLLPGGDYIRSVEVWGSGWTTADGIGIGSTLTEIEAAYGNDYVNENGMIIFYSDKTDAASSQIYFIMEGDAVSVFGIA